MYFRIMACIVDFRVMSGSGFPSCPIPGSFLEGFGLLLEIAVDLPVPLFQAIETLAYRRRLRVVGLMPVAVSISASISASTSVSTSSSVLLLAAGGLCIAYGRQGISFVNSACCICV